MLGFCGLAVRLPSWGTVDHSVGKEIHLVLLHRPSPFRPAFLHPPGERVGDPSGISREPVRQDEQTRMRVAGGEGIAGGDQEVVPVVGDHDSLILRRGPEMDRIVLRQEWLSIHGGENVQSQSGTDPRTRVWNVLVEIEASGFPASPGATSHVPTGRVKGSSSATRSGVQYDSRASRSSISSG